MSAGFCRISYAILLLSITPPSKRPRRFLWTVIGIQFVFDVVTVIISYVQCRPVEAFWDTSLDGHCWPPYVQQYMGFLQGTVCSAIDLVLALFPVSMLWKLNMKWQQKAYISGIMGVGLIAMWASIVKTVHLRAFTSTQDLTFAMAKPAIWWTVEANLILITVSVPIVAPIIMPLKSRTDAPRDVHINTFNSWKRAQAQKKSGTESSFELLQGETLTSEISDIDP
ncbi:hypothetical protein F5Y00DRAFT_273207 [Daldinia vernicosa]|uniref:uncharacterized protein n=1 Tax=Daldinia vernicosa TaxID=114800 RepID=UPI002008B763|nr:uncharacterized protein F5Y00DRAFT_273207 [Daldinia vernicosa]KAI0852679.1 hypothetical protein F5Y00DRAFT_273207 [Daldinia vernicosa]